MLFKSTETFEGNINVGRIFIFLLLIPNIESSFFISLFIDEIIYDDEANLGLETLPNLEFKFVSGNILISNIRPYFKKIWLATSNGGRSNDVLGFMSLVSETEGYLMNLLYQDDFFDYMLRTSKGSKMPRGDKKAIMEWGLAIPSVVIRKLYSKMVKEFYDVITVRSAENQSLTKLRDTLLPKLISGELQIPDVIENDGK